VLSNHDVVRHATRFGMKDPAHFPKSGIGPDDEQPDAALGLTRARAATQLMLALPGSAYLFEGEELGLPEHTTLPADAREDPTFFRTGGKIVGRDGARVPLPWVAEAPAYGFSPSGRSWLPQPESFASLAVDREDGVPGSTLEFYRAAIALRREYALGDGSIDWRVSSPDELSFDNAGVRVVVNFGSAPIPLPSELRVLLTSDDSAIADGSLLPNRAAWLALA
jgi:alpha-glucosidase